MRSFEGLEGGHVLALGVLGADLLGSEEDYFGFLHIFQVDALETGFCRDCLELFVSVGV